MAGGVGAAAVAAPRQLTRWYGFDEPSTEMLYLQRFAGLRNLALVAVAKDVIDDEARHLSFLRIATALFGLDVLVTTLATLRGSISKRSGLMLLASISPLLALTAGGQRTRH